jgi:hypothetical protein
MEANDCIMVLDEGVDEELAEMTTCCKASAPVKFPSTKKQCKAGGPNPH